MNLALSAASAASSGHLYESLAAEIAKMITAGVIKSGEKLPSIRKLSSQRDVSLSTVMQAFRVLEDRGLIEVRPQAGFFVRRQLLRQVPKTSTPPAQPIPVAIDDVRRRILQESQSGQGVALGCALIDRELFPNMALQRLLSGLTRRQPDLIGSYAFPPGRIELRRQLARRSLEWGGELDPEELVITSGCIEALHLALRAVTQSGDVVAIESPVYYGILNLLEALGLKAMEIPTHPQTGMSVEALELATRSGEVKAVLVVANYGNPLGSLMPDDNKRRMVQLLAERRIPIVEDDIYGDFYHGTERPTPLKGFDRSGNVLLCSSFSKMLAPGFRVGWVAAGRYSRQVERLKSITTMSTPEILQLTLAQFIEAGGFDHHLRRLRRACVDQVHLMFDAVCRYFPAEAKVSLPQGGYVLWIELPPQVDAVRLLQQAIAEGISFAPGVLFSSTPGQYANCLRLSAGDRWRPEVEQAIKRLGELIVLSR